MILELNTKMNSLSFIVSVISITMTTTMKISQVERISNNFVSFLNEITLEDSIEIRVNNYGMFPQSIAYYLYLPQNIDVLDFSSKKIETSLLAESPKISALKSFTLKDDHLFNDEQLSGMSKITLSDGEISKFQTNYKLIKDDVEKQLNSFLIVIEFNSKNPEQLKTVISSANFDIQNYPNEARHRWLIRCSPDYSIKLNVTSFEIEENSDEILLYDATLSGNNLVGEITSLGEIETTSSELLISFKSDCDVTNKGFEAAVEFVEKPTERITQTANTEKKTENSTYETSTTNETATESFQKLVTAVKPTTNVPTTADEETTNFYLTTNEERTSSPTTTSNYQHELPTFEVTQKPTVLETTTQQSDSSDFAYYADIEDDIEDGDDKTFGKGNATKELIEKADEKSIAFTFFITPNSGSWFEAKQMCEEQGGNLIYESLKPKWGLKRKILEYKNLNKSYLWVGIKKNKFKQWQLLDGTEQWVLDWNPGEPNNYGNRENCAHLQPGLLLNDNDCYTYFYGLCEKQTLV